MYLIKTYPSGVFFVYFIQLYSLKVLLRVINGRESIQLPYTASKMSTSSREAIL